MNNFYVTFLFALNLLLYNFRTPLSVIVSMFNKVKTYIR